MVSCYKNIFLKEMMFYFFNVRLIYDLYLVLQNVK